LSPQGADSSGMKDLPDLGDGDIDRLLAGKRTEGAEDLATFVSGVRETFIAPPSPEAARAHIAAAAAAAASAAGEVGPAARKATPSPAPARSRWRRRTVFGMSVATMTLSLSGLALAATATGGLVAAHGDLPGPIQRVVAQAASGVGITIPRGEPSTSPAGGVQTGASLAPSLHGESSEPSPGDEGKGHDNKAGSLPSNAAATATAHAGDGQGEGRGNGSDQGQAISNHGNCVAYAAKIQDTLGLTGDERSGFVAIVAGNPDAVTNPVADGGKPDAACQTAINAAKAAAASGTQGGDHGGDGHGSPPPAAPLPEPTATVHDGHGSHG